jgi:predicted dehydrogenase
MGGDWRVKFGILGFAHVHAPGYAARVMALPEIELVAIADHQQERLLGATSQFGGRPYDKAGDLLARDDIEAVIVMAETSLHPALVDAAARAGKHVLCEKPLAITQSAAQGMIDICRKSNVKLGTIFPMRFNPAALALRDAILAGEIGTPVAVKATNPGKMPPGWFQDPALAGGGAVMDHVVHVADLLRWIFHTEVVEVYAEIDTRFTPDLQVDDLGVLMIRLANGMTASLDTSWSRPKTWPTWGGLTIDVIGDHGVLEVDAFAEKLRLVEDRGPQSAFLSWGEDADLDLLRGFVDAIQRDTDVPVTGEDGLRALEVALCAYESARRKDVVACPDCLAETPVEK